MTSGYATTGYEDTGPYEPGPYESGAYGSPYGSIDVDAYATGVETPTFDVFYQSLSPYGRWIDHPSYGQVFIPSDRGYVPFRDGRWVYTSSGWYWQDNEPFGWAVSHYGRWDHDPGYGWLWVPDTRWSPAWVDWRRSGDMVGWAPLPPRHQRVRAYAPRWNFVRQDELLRHDVRRHMRHVDSAYVEQRTQPIQAPPVRVRPQPIPREHFAQPRVRPGTVTPARPFPREERQPVRGYEQRPELQEPRRPPPPRRVEPPPRRAEPPSHQAVPPSRPDHDRGRGHEDRDREDRGHENHGRGHDRGHEGHRGDDRGHDRDHDRDHRHKD